MRRVVPLLLLAASACAHARTAAAPAASVPAPAVQVAAVTPPRAAPAPAACRTDGDCATDQLCLAGSCAVIDATTTACNAISARFDYDSALLRPDDLVALQREARCLQARPGTRAEIEGNCDERGTAEYNLHLGQRRASAAQKYLADLGVPAGRVGTVSYGKERPICAVHNEDCWAENRRDDIVKIQ